MVDKVKIACTPIVDKLGYELAKTTFEQEHGIWELTLFIKSKSGKPITHEDCKRVSLAVDETIERLDITDEPYHLSVSSLGAIKGETKQ